MRPSQIRSLDCRARDAASGGKPRSGDPGRNVVPRDVPRRQAEAVAETGPPPALPGLGNKAAVASVG